MSTGKGLLPFSNQLSVFSKSIIKLSNFVTSPTHAKMRSFPWSYVENGGKPRTKLGQGRVLARLGSGGCDTAFFSSCYHRIKAEAQVKPAPKAPIITRLPSLTRPDFTASSRANGIDAADVLPYRSMFMKIFSIGN